MPSEFRRGAVRILSNYARLLATFVLGIIFVRVFIDALGTEAFGLISVLGSSIGLAKMCKEVMSTSLNRELARAWHDPDRDVFIRTYNGAMVVSAALGLVTALIFSALYLCLPLLDISETLADAAGWVVLAKGAHALLGVVFAPPYLMWRITERMAAYNLWQTLMRGCDLFAVLVLITFVGFEDPNAGLLVYAALYFVFSTAVLAAAIAVMMTVESGLLPNPARFTWPAVRQVVGTAGWNSVVATALNLHIRVDQIIMNVAFGLVMGNTIFTLAVRVTGYVRMLATGITGGLDIVSARVSSAEDQKVTMRDLVHHSTRLHALVAFPAGLLVVLYAEPILDLWVARVVNDPAVIDQSAVLTRLLAIGMVARAVSDGWARMLYGAGHIRRYAPLILAGGLLNPVLAVALIMLLPESIAYTGPAIVYAAIFLGFHFLGLPIVGARCLDIPLRDVLGPLGRPAVATLGTGLIPAAPLLAGVTVDLPVFLSFSAAYGLAYAAVCWRFALTVEERQRLLRAVGRRLGWRGGA